jgi:hypothetical protein
LIQIIYGSPNDLPEPVDIVDALTKGTDASTDNRDHDIRIYLRQPVVQNLLLARKAGR